MLWIFKKIKINYSLNRKVSKLQINTDDILILNCITPKKTIINLTINFFSRIPNREIYIDGKNFSIHANILNNSITLIEQKKTRIIKFKNFSMNETFKLENLSILNDDLKDICTLKEGNKLINLISKIKKMKINLSVPHFFGEEIKNLKKSVKKKWISSSGSASLDFEKR